MSAGQFLRAFYELNSGEVASIRIQPETAALVMDGVTNTVPAGPADVPGSAAVSRGNRALGINARKVSIRFTAEPPTGYSDNSVITLPWLQPTTWEALALGSTGTYLGAGVQLVGKSPERIR